MSRGKLGISPPEILGDVAHALQGNVDKLRQAITVAIAREVGRAFSQVNLSRIVDDLATGYNLKVEISLVPKLRKGKRKK
ncbi:MAG: hypothetical protein HUU37_02440 [Bdellovibrionales bacterium]|nr:hypothetical protein [Bdellovibrionales bacterium]